MPEGPESGAKGPNPLRDYEAAMEYISRNAQQWNIDKEKIAVAGFSAGGHLAGCAATMARSKPAAVILGYPSLEKESIQKRLPTAPDVLQAVDENTCPCFVFATRDDKVVPVKNSIKFIMALTEYGIPYESHIYAYGPHGVSTCDTAVMHPIDATCSRTPHWVEDSIAWLKETLRWQEV